MAWWNKKDTEAGTSQSNGIVVNEPVEEHYPTVPIADIKDYLVEEFEKSDRQQKEIAKLEKKLEEARIVENKLNATMVTLDEYSHRLKKKEQEEKLLKEKLDDKNLEITKLNNKVNDLRINAYKKEDYRLEVQEQSMKFMAKEVTKKVSEHKGIVPKDLLKKWLDEEIIRTESRKV